MSVECPHCLSRVLPSGDGRCPACGENVNVRSGENADLTGLIIRESDRLPSHCFQCDAPTDRVIRIDRSSDPGEETRSMLSAIGRALLHLLALPFGLLIVAFGGRRASTASRIRLKLPQCATCARLAPTRIRHIDFAQGEISLAVHRGFKQRLLELNPGPRSAA